MSRLMVLSVVAGLGLAIAGCGGSARSKVAKGSAEAGGKIVVREFDMSGTTVTSYKAMTDGFGIEIAQKIADRLNEKGLQAEAVPRGASVSSSSSLVEGEVTRIDGGSRAARYLVGFGAGGTEFTVKGHVLGPDGQTLGEFSDGRRSGFGMFGGDTVALVHKCVEHVAEDVAGMIATGNYAKNAK